MLMTQEKPKDFVTTMNVTGLIVIVGNEILLLKRSKNEKYSPLVWCLPSGSVDDNETNEEACIRELKEETGIIIDIKDIKPTTTSYHNYDEYPEINITYFAFAIHLQSKPKVIISEEHDDYMWVDINKIDVPLINGLDKIIENSLFILNYKP